MRHTVVLDFDKTLTYTDTMLGFLIFCGRRERFFIPKLLYYLSSMVQAKIGIISNTELKKRGVRLFIRHLERETIERFARLYSQKIKLNRIYHSLVYDPESDYIVVSGSFASYLKPLFPDFVEVIGSYCRYKKGVGTELAWNCYGAQKVQALKERGITKIDVLYTDSISDLPLAEISEKILIVKGDTVYECDSVAVFKEYFA